MAAVLMPWGSVLGDELFADPRASRFGHAGRDSLQCWPAVGVVNDLGVQVVNPGEGPPIGICDQADQLVVQVPQENLEGVAVFVPGRITVDQKRPDRLACINVRWIKPRPVIRQRRPSWA